MAYSMGEIMGYSFHLLKHGLFENDKMLKIFILVPHCKQTIRMKLSGVRTHDRPLISLENYSKTSSRQTHRSKIFVLLHSVALETYTSLITCTR